MWAAYPESSKGRGGASCISVEIIIIKSIPEAERTPSRDVAWLKRKIDAGATSRHHPQFFFEADTFFRFPRRLRGGGDRRAHRPGILPIENWAGVQKFAASCGTSIPA